MDNAQEKNDEFAELDVRNLCMVDIKDEEMKLYMLLNFVELRSKCNIPLLTHAVTMLKNACCSVLFATV